MKIFDDDDDDDDVMMVMHFMSQTLTVKAN